MTVTTHFLQDITLKLNFQHRLVSSDYLQECRKPHTNPSLRTSCQNWAIPGLSWVTKQERPQLFPASDSVCGRCSSAEKEAEEIEQPEEDGAGQLPESDNLPRRFRHQRGEIQDGRKAQHHRALNAGSGLHGDPVPNIKVSIKGQLKSPSGTEKTPPQESFVSQVPLRLQIKVSGRRGSLGISIAGGKGSLPYKDHDEGIFISRVNKGGASEKAGVHVGDRLLEVNGLNMQAATHHEAVSALRNAGSCIKMKVLRERLLPRGQACDPEDPQDPQNMTGRQLCSQDGGGQRGKQPKMESVEDCLSKKIEAVVCNGNGVSDLESDLNRTLSQMEAQALIKNDSLQGGKQTMTIPRIILTHPSTSDEDVEFLTQIPSREPVHDSDIPDRHVHCFDSAFYPP
ncbi:inaD-like protein [Epinephelus moara]|uniref:inaD-like protein n=1 Tax=Epinephelus moara TaxID=300413 RepID=UPI00214EE321|nr:inaD-like protein [Epinephelus moara]